MISQYCCFFSWLDLKRTLQLYKLTWKKNELIRKILMSCIFITNTLKILGKILFSIPLFNQRYKNDFFFSFLFFFPSNYTLIFQIDGQLNHIYQKRIRFKDKGLD